MIPCDQSWEKHTIINNKNGSVIFLLTKKKMQNPIFCIKKLETSTAGFSDIINLMVGFSLKSLVVLGVYLPFRFNLANFLWRVFLMGNFKLEEFCIF